MKKHIGWLFTILLGVILYGVFILGICTSCASEPNQEQPSMIVTDNKVKFTRSEYRTITVQIIELEGHKYIVGDSYVGNGAGLSIVHAESCECKQKDNNY